MTLRKHPVGEISVLVNAAREAVRFGQLSAIVDNECNVRHTSAALPLASCNRVTIRGVRLV